MLIDIRDDSQNLNEPNTGNHYNELAYDFIRAKCYKALKWYNESYIPYLRQKQSESKKSRPTPQPAINWKTFFASAKVETNKDFITTYKARIAMDNGCAKEDIPNYIECTDQYKAANTICDLMDYTENNMIEVPDAWAEKWKKQRKEHRR